MTASSAESHSAGVHDGAASFCDQHALGSNGRVADVTADADITPQSRGLEAIARGFMDLGVPDQEQLALELPVYDALYAWARRQVASAG